MEESNIESEMQIHEVFWFRVIESADLESEELTDQILKEYIRSVDTSKRERFSVSIAS